MIFTKGINCGAIDKDYYDLCQALVEELKTALLDKKKQIVENELFSKYGNLPELKDTAISEIVGASPDDMTELISEYQKCVESIITEKETWVDTESDLYDEYISYFEHVIVFAKDCARSSGKKASNLVRTDCSVEESLMYLFDTDSVDDAKKKLEERQYRFSKEFGLKGEKEVDYAIKWLPLHYKSIEKTNSGKYGEPAIVLSNSDYIDESQEFDHIVIGPQGVFVMETKNYTGRIIIDSNGNWIRKRPDGREEGERNPSQQVRRHEALLRSIIGNDVPIISVIVMSNPKIIIEGAENSKIPIIKSDRIEEYISAYKNDHDLSEGEIEDIYKTIEKYRTSKE